MDISPTHPNLLHTLSSRLAMKVLLLGTLLVAASGARLGSLPYSGQPGEFSGSPPNIDYGAAGVSVPALGHVLTTNLHTSSGHLPLHQPGFSNAQSQILLGSEFVSESHFGRNVNFNPHQQSVNSDFQYSQLLPAHHVATSSGFPTLPYTQQDSQRKQETVTHTEQSQAQASSPLRDATDHFSLQRKEEASRVSQHNQDTSSSSLSQQKQDFSSSVSHKKHQDSSSSISQQRQDASSPFSQQQQKDASSLMSQQRQDFNSPQSQQKQDFSSSVSQQAHQDHSSPISQKQHDQNSPLSQQRQDTGSPLSHQRQDTSSPLSQQRQDISSPMSQQRQDTSSPFSQQRQEEVSSPTSAHVQDTSSPSSHHQHESISHSQHPQLQDSRTTSQAHQQGDNQDSTSHHPFASPAFTHTKTSEPSSLYHLTQNYGVSPHMDQSFSAQQFGQDQGYQGMEQEMQEGPVAAEVHVVQTKHKDHRGDKIESHQVQISGHIESVGDYTELGVFQTFSVPPSATLADGSFSTSFSCQNYGQGFYAEPESQCRMFHVCAPTRSPEAATPTQYRFTFSCGEGQWFDQHSLTCTTALSSPTSCLSAVVLFPSSHAASSVLFSDFPSAFPPNRDVCYLAQGHVITGVRRR